MKRDDEDRYPSRALAKGMALLAELSKSGAPISLAELSRTVGLGKPSTLRLLRTLEGLGYVHRENGNARLRRLPDAMESGVPSPAPMNASLKAEAEEAMRNLAVETGETVSLAGLFEDHIRVIHVLESPRLMRMSNYVGRILQPYASGLGKAVTAYQPHEVRQRLVSVYGLYQFTQHTISDPARIETELGRVRDSGFAYDLEETVEGGCCVAAPIRMSDGSVRAAISVSQPKNRYDEAKRERIEELLISALKKIVL